jgi:hypothetical protein
MTRQSAMLAGQTNETESGDRTPLQTKPELTRELLGYAEKYLDQQLALVRAMLDAGGVKASAKHADGRAQDLEAFAAGLNGKRPAGRPPGSSRPGKTGWDKFKTPEARSAEMKRRRAVWRRRKQPAQAEKAVA